MKSKRITKKIVAIILILILDSILIIFSFSKSTDIKDVTYDAKKVENEYYEQDFVQMMERIEEQHFYGEDMRVYKEAMDAYILKMSCEIYLKVGDNDAYISTYNCLKMLANNCEPENAKLFADFVNQVNK